MMPKKKVVLFIVEGFNDQTALALPFENIITTDYVKFDVINGDLTSDFTGKNIAAKIGDRVSAHCKVYGYKREDFIEVVLLVDMDGAFIEDTLITKKENYTKAFYDTDTILYAHPDRLRKTHEIKRQNLSRLVSLSKVYKTIPFSMYFFSCNLDHVICGDANLAQKEKGDEAEKFRNLYHTDAVGFVSFFHSKDIAVCEKYSDSWEYIKKNANSLKRSSNLHVFLSSEAIRTPRDFSKLLATGKEDR